MANKIQLRRDTAAVWASVNPVLADGEMGLESDTQCAKFGDGSTPWNGLGYLRFPGGGPTAVDLTGTPPAGTIGLSYSFTPTIAGGTGPYTVTNTGAALPSGTTLNSSTGAITGTLIGSPASYAGIVLHAVDSLGASANLPLSTIVVSGVGAALSISGTPPTTGQVGTAYSFTPTAAGGTGTKTFSLASGTLPAGLSINSSTGAVTGTPTTVGTATGLVIRVTDSTSATADLAAFSIAVSAATLTISGTPATSATVGTPYSFTPTSTGGTAP
jgi:hypothetical protein